MSHRLWFIVIVIIRLVSNSPLLRPAFNRWDLHGIKDHRFWICDRLYEKPQFLCDCAVVPYVGEPGSDMPTHAQNRCCTVFDWIWFAHYEKQNTCMCELRWSTRSHACGNKVDSHININSTGATFFCIVVNPLSSPSVLAICQRLLRTSTIFFLKPCGGGSTLTIHFSVFDAVGIARLGSESQQ